MNARFLLSCSENGLDLSCQDEPEAPSMLRAQQAGAVLGQMLRQFVVPARVQAVTSSKQIDALAWSPLQQVLHRHLQRRLSAESRMNVKISGEFRHEFQSKRGRANPRCQQSYRIQDLASTKKCRMESGLR